MKSVQDSKVLSLNPPTFFEDSNAVFGSNKSSEDPITNPKNISIKLTPFVPQYEGIGDSSTKLL